MNVEEAPYDNVVQKLARLQTHKAGYDIFSMPYEYLGSFVEQGYISPIDDYLSDPTLAAPGSTRRTSSRRCGRTASNWKGPYYGMPSESPVMMMFYRKDLFSDPTEQANFKAKYGYDLAPAKTWQQFQDIAEFFTRPKGATPSPVRRCRSPLLRHRHGRQAPRRDDLEYFNYMWTLGGGLFDPLGNLAVNSPENSKALTTGRGLD